MADNNHPAMASPQPERQSSVDVSVLQDHLPTGFTAAFDPSPDSGSSSGTPPRRGSPRPEPDPANPDSSLKLQGGDVHRDLYKLDASARPPTHRRAHTFHLPPHSSTGDLSVAGPSGGPNDDDSDALSMTVSEQRLPGGFRRQFILRRQLQAQALARRRSFVAGRMPVTRNFVEFLELYGNFAGEELEDSDDEAITSEDSDADEEAAVAALAAAASIPGRPAETRPLLGHRKSSRPAASKVADAGEVRTFFTLLKAFVGTGIMFLPKAFNNGGLLFSTTAMLLVSAVTMFAFHLLLECKRQTAVAGVNGYGDIGAEIAGPHMKTLILASITLSQLGFVCSGMVFFAENMAIFLEAVTGRDSSPVSTPALIGIQLLALVPLSFIRNISKLGPVALFADVFILLGVGYIFWYCVSHLAADGMSDTVVLFNPARYTLMVGSAIFTFEGIGLILPIEASMADPARFEPLLGLVMAIITAVFTAVGALCYATFGSRTRIEVISNFPQSSRLVNAVQLLYALAVMAGNPVQLFPAIRILEVRIFGHRSGRRSPRTKWVKNGFRTAALLVCAVVSTWGAGKLDRFVALIGSVACVPLVYVYPAFLHYRAVAKTGAQRWQDVGLMVLGVVGMVYTTGVTVANAFL